MNKAFVICWEQEGTTEHGIICAFRKESEAQSLMAQLKQVSPLTFTIVELPYYG